MSSLKKPNNWSDSAGDGVVAGEGGGGPGRRAGGVFGGAG